MNKFEYNQISKNELKKLNEDNLMFITNPGRMGDEDGITFIIKNNNELTIYRVDGLMYRKDAIVSFNDILKQFPKWHDTWKHNNEKDFIGKYKYLYMGFGNGLSIDNSIYNDYKPYLNKLVEEYLKDEIEEERNKLIYVTTFNVWKKAFMDMVNDKRYILK